MSDAALLWSSDFDESATGDIALVTGDTLGQQRILRRLLTNPGDYLWQPDFGAGLGAFVGAPCDVLAIKAKIRSQIFLENTVSRTPEPVIEVRSANDGSIFVQIQYIDATSSTATNLAFLVS